MEDRPSVYGNAMSDELYKAYDKKSSLPPPVPPQPGPTAMLLQKIADLEKRIAHMENLPIDVSDGLTSSTKQLKDGLGLGLQGSAAQSVASPFTGYPWIESIVNTIGKLYSAVFGTGSSSFSKGTAAALQALEIEVGVSPASQVSLQVGNSTPANDQLMFKY